MSSLFQSTADILSLVPSIRRGETPTISRCISLIENEQPGYLDLLQSLPGDNHANKTIGITGPPGAGKSTMIDRMLSLMVDERNKKIAVLCVDPSSPFHHGALLGDRIRMSRWFNDGRVYIRSLASRGNVGGLSPTVIEITDLLKAADFDYIMIETVGVGQTEVEIAGIADATTVVLTPGSGDDIQAMKSGLMEVADILVVNKSDYPGADLMVRNLSHAIMENGKKTPVLKTIASEGTGISELVEAIGEKLSEAQTGKSNALAEKAFQLIQKKRMVGISKKMLEQQVGEALQNGDFNLYRFVSQF